MLVIGGYFEVPTSGPSGERRPGVILESRSFCGPSRVVLRMFWIVVRLSEAVLESFWNCSGIVLGLSSDRSGVILGSS